MTQKVDSAMLNSALEPLMVLEPFLVNKIWGGHNLAALKNIGDYKEKLGETWEVSCLKDGPSKFKGSTIDQLIDQTKLPYLIKFLDTTDNLSVQVHPGDDYAKEHEQTKGKTECWLILKAEQGAGIYLGFKPGVSKDEFEQAINNSKASLDQYLNFVPVREGDFFYVPAGTVHAIGKGITLAEIQQSSGVTYRVWDWNRVDDNGVGRELHIKKSLDVLEFNQDKNHLDYFKHQKVNKNESVKLITHEDFVVEYKAYDQLNMKELIDNRYGAIVVLEGTLKAVVDGKETIVKAYESALITQASMISEVDTSQARYLFIY